MAIYELTSTQIRRIEATTFDEAGLKERGDLQRVLRSQIEVIAPGVLVIAEEFCEWEDSRRRIDLLALDKDANLVVIELKRSEDGGHMELQAIRYAAMVSAMTFEKAVEVYAAHLARSGSAADPRASILEFLGWEEPDEDRFAQDVRIVLASAEFSKELTSAVMWLNDRGLDIRCVRLRPHRDNGRVLLDVQQVVPLPEASDYMVRIREKGVRERTARQEHSSIANAYLRFWTGLLQRAKAKTNLHADVSPANCNWVGRRPAPGVYLSYALPKGRGPRVDLSFNGSSRHELFDRVFAQKDQIERDFGGPLKWQRDVGQYASRVEAELAGGSVRDEDNWEAMQDQMINLMIRFENALRRAIAALPK